MNIPVLLWLIFYYIRLVSPEEANQIKVSRLGVMLSVVFYSCNPWKYKLWQALTSVELWAENSTEKTVKSLNRLGLTQSKVTARHHIDKLIQSSDADVQTWKNKLQVNN